MRRLFASVFGSAKPSRPRVQNSSRGIRLGVENLESRLLMHGGGFDLHTLAAPAANLYAASAHASIFNPGDIVVRPTGGIYVDAEPTLEQDLPRLHSKADAPVKIHLDFTGHYQSLWWEYDGGQRVDHPNVHTPGFNTDGDRFHFSPAEKAMIYEVWARVAEDFAPFNVDVTTEDPGTFNNGQALKVAIGGSNDWIGDYSGYASIGSFQDDAPNVVYVFSQNIINWSNAGNLDGDGRPQQIAPGLATTASHEAGHAFGLRHHSLYNANGDVIDFYDPGTSTWTPIMGFNLSSDRTTWAAGRTDDGVNTHQDDMAVLASAANGFGYRAEDHGNTRATATTLSNPIIYRPRLSASGVIGNTGDFDVFKFTAAGKVQIRVDVAQYGANLMPRMELWSAKSKLAIVNPGVAGPVTLNRNLAAGTYYVVVKSHGDYGDVGQYRVTVDLGPGLSQTLSADASIAVKPGQKPVAATVQKAQGGVAGFVPMQLGLGTTDDEGGRVERDQVSTEATEVRGPGLKVVDLPFSREPHS